jgi:hypoxanthine-DNA glycosylase
MKHSFPPIITSSSRVLILGSLPGDESLRQQQYYAHPRNQFWRILAEIYQVLLPDSYEDRRALILQKQLALWDVVQHGEREGSLDQAIRNATPNDFAWLFKTYPELQAIVFNGRKAYDLFERRVLTQPQLAGSERWPRLLLPSTSPAATLPLAAKIERWRQITAL